MTENTRFWPEDTQLLGWTWYDPAAGAGDNMQPAIEVRIHLHPDTDPLIVGWELQRGYREIIHALSPGAIHEHTREADPKASSTEDETCYPTTSHD